MKRVLILISIVYIFLFICGSIFAFEEKTISLGGSATWRAAENRTSVTEVTAVRPHPVLVLSSASSNSVFGYSAATGVLGNFSALSEHALDMSISFDERDSRFFRDSIGNYRLTIPHDVESVDRNSARAGNGAALFGRSGAFANSGPILIQPQNRNALFSSGNHIRDFTIEFWLYPINLENGEQILTWTATGSGQAQSGRNNVQRISCSASRNRLQWSFTNFFASINASSNRPYINIEFTGNTPIVPKTWSHHLIRFDASTGLLEYLVNGVTENIFYTTATGRENSEVYTPVIGNNSSFSLGERFSGMIDEFKIHNVCAGRSSVQRYASSGGRMETRAIDLGENLSSILRIDVSGGRTSIRGASSQNNSRQNEYRQNGRFKFSDDCEMNFFIRASENPYLLNNNRWISFTPGIPVSGINGRYVQIAVDFYPSADGESSPYLEQLNIVFMPGEPPLPPRNLTAIAADGAVQLRWRHSPAENTVGYLVYYSDVRGELFGSDAILGPSPIDVGLTNNVLIEGLKNGTLYYFRVAAYDRVTGELNYHAGEFSVEVTARPLAGLRP
ncbi:MAG: fibronectin type III domain-containing protein [Treponema sp.]|nr:fibronectin type III domain-containing protein [Treponema sp.]